MSAAPTLTPAFKVEDRDLDWRHCPHRPLEFCTDTQRNPENVRGKYLEYVPSRGHPISFPLSKDPSPRELLRCLWRQAAHPGSGHHVITATGASHQRWDVGLELPPARAYRTSKALPSCYIKCRFRRNALFGAISIESVRRNGGATTSANFPRPTRSLGPDSFRYSRGASKRPGSARSIRSSFLDVLV